jgi:hypothetical protein
MNTTEPNPRPATEPGVVRVAAHHAVVKRLGHWTTAREFEVRAHRGSAVLDLRSPRVPEGDIRIEVDLDHATLTLLLPDDAYLDDWDLRRAGRGRVRDPNGPRPATGRRVVLTGQLGDGVLRVRRGGVAVLTALCSRAYLDDLRRARRTGRFPTVDDPTRAA